MPPPSALELLDTPIAPAAAYIASGDRAVNSRCFPTGLSLLGVSHKHGSEAASASRARQAIICTAAAWRRHEDCMAEAELVTRDLGRALTRKVGRAIQDYRMIQEGDRVMVAVSGGKDSYTLLDLLERLRRRSPVRFELVAANVDQGYNGFRSDIIEDHLKAGGHRYHIEMTEIAHTIRKKMDPADTHCSLCARLRRGVLYRLATQLDCNKIALGHHADDIIETLLMLQLFNGQIKAMPPVLRAKNDVHTVIRPMVYVWEQDVIQYAREMKFPVVCCCCPACGDTS